MKIEHGLNNDNSESRSEVKIAFIPKMQPASLNGMMQNMKLSSKLNYEYSKDQVDESDVCQTYQQIKSFYRFH